MTELTSSSAHQTVASSCSFYRDDMDFGTPDLEKKKTGFSETLDEFEFCSYAGFMSGEL